ncbi:nitrate/nitrite transporter [Armatimonas sp.]|uniref:nitrate/nitrite transporter n=1 Tax=Armatimonas sp. TaxID=1872638 RepID=UPI00286B5193|nr:nitrate/nitrite transporter [Armatimonas sp.]
MATQSLPEAVRTGASWLSDWKPEDSGFWEAGGKATAWKTLWVTTYCLLLAFATWFVVSAVLVRLTGIGFKLDKSQLFWLAAMPGLAAGTLRIIHTFLIPIFGTRHTVAISTLFLLVPCIGWAWAIQNPETPFSVLMLLAFLAGLGGGNFSSFMPSTSLFFPKKQLGTALGIQAGIGNFGVSVVQFVTPIVIGIAMVGGTQLFNDPKKNIHDKPLHLQNAFLIWIPLIIIGAIWAWVALRSVPVKATFREQTDIFKEKHTWIMTALYIMTFGSFSGFSASFGLMIKELYGKFPDAPDALKYAFIGPFLGALLRVLFGPICDKIGGAKVTMLSGIGLTVCAVLATRYTAPTSVDQFGGFLWTMLGLFFFSGIGNASTFKQMPMIFPPRQASGVIGWTSAIAAYGPFLFASSIGAILGATGSPTAFFWGAAVFYLFCLVLNWHFYTRKGAEKPC